LDETLVHCAPFPRLENPKDAASHVEDMIVYSRPGLHEFLLEMSKYYEIVVFSAGGKAYAQKIVTQCLEPQRGHKVIDHLLYWDHVTIIPE
jgi:TFIIF-interacting CTD phosphatase-like protein